MSDLSEFKNDNQVFNLEPSDQMVEIKENIKTFDFIENPIAVMSLSTLMRTHKEDDVYGNPVRGVYHHELIQNALMSCQKYGLSYEIEQIFAVKNNSRTQPGVIILPQVEKMYGDKAVEAHIIRRVFTTIKIKDNETDELTTTLAIAYHQEGISIAIGPLVKICHNQCILSPERIASNYGKDKVSLEDLFTKMDEWLGDFHSQMGADRERIQRMKDRILTAEEAYQMIGILQTLRVAHDSKNKELSSKVKSYPLNQAQISIFTEALLTLQQTEGEM